MQHTEYGGFTLAEAMMATVVLSIAAAGVLLPFTTGAGLRAEGNRRTLGVKLAADKMEQIIHAPFENIMDYVGTEQEGQVRDAAGDVFTDSNYSKFSRIVSCQYVTVPQQPEQSEPENCDFILVTVTVRWYGKDIATINRLVSE